MVSQQPGTGGNPDTTAAVDPDRLRRFLQQGHIFSVAVQEVLEAKYLAEVSPDPMTVAQFHLLKLITLNGGRQVGEVAQLLGVSSPAVSKNIDKLERLGLVKRMPSPGDRRVTLLLASEKGQALVERYEEIKASRLAPILAQFEPAELDHLSELLRRFTSRLYRLESAGVDFCLRCAAYGDSTCPIADVHGNCPYRRPRQKATGLAGCEAT